MFDSTQGPSTNDDRIDAFDLLYDEECGLCRATARTAVRLIPRGRIRATGLRSDRAARLLPRESEDGRLRSFHLAAPTGRTWSGGAAVPETIALVPYLRPVADAMRRSRVLRGATDSAYGWIAGHRPAIARWLPASWKRPLSPREAGPLPSSDATTAAYDRPRSDRRTR